jgi:hypothetical protein
MLYNANKIIQAFNVTTTCAQENVRTSYDMPSCKSLLAIVNKPKIQGIYFNTTKSTNFITNKLSKRLR